MRVAVSAVGWLIAIAAALLIAFIGYGLVLAFSQSHEDQQMIACSNAQNTPEAQAGRSKALKEGNYNEYQAAWLASHPVCDY
jgi:hypothetical protein